GCARGVRKPARCLDEIVEGRTRRTLQERDDEGLLRTRPRLCAGGAHCISAPIGLWGLRNPPPGRRVTIDTDRRRSGSRELQCDWPFLFVAPPSRLIALCSGLLQEPEPDQPRHN